MDRATNIQEFQQRIVWRRHASLVLALLLVALNLTDWSLTYMALTHYGLTEVNNALASWISTPIGFMVKLVIPAIIGWRFYVRFSDRAVYRVLTGACVMYTLVVLWNTYAIYLR